MAHTHHHDDTPALTPQHKQVLDVLAQSGRALSAYDVLEKLRRTISSSRRSAISPSCAARWPRA